MIIKFKEHAIAGLRGQPKELMKSKLNEEQKMVIENWLISGRIPRGTHPRDTE